MKARKRRPHFNPHYPQHGVKVVGQAHPFNIEEYEVTTTRFDADGTSATTVETVKVNPDDPTVEYLDL